METTPQQPSSGAAPDGPSDGDTAATGAESAFTSGDEGSQRGGVHKMSAFTTFIGFVTKQSYIAGLILMMAWSIIYLSWMTFVLLLWALLIWILPISTTRNRCLYTSPLLVFYAEAIIICNFIYSLDTNLPEHVGKINLKEVGFEHRTIPFIPLLVQIVITVMFWLTLRQFLREQRLRKHNVDEGIVLQPFGVIFSGPSEEVTTIEEQQDSGLVPTRGHSVTMTFLGNTLNEFLGKYWILLCGLMFLVISLQGDVDVFKIIYMVLFLILLNIFMMSFAVFRWILKVFCWVVVLYSMTALCMIYTFQFEDFPGLWTNGTGLTIETLEILGLQRYNDISMLLLNLLIPTAFIVLIMIQLHYYHDNFLQISKIERAGYRPGKLDEDEGHAKKEEEEEGPPEETHIEIDETDGGSQTSKKKSLSTRSQLKLQAMKAYRYFHKHLDPVQAILWRMLEIHIMKLVFLTIFLVITRENAISAVNGILLLIVFVPMALTSLHRLCCLFSMLWVSLVLLAKMIFQLDFKQWFPHENLITNCTNDTGFPIQGDFNISTWFGFDKVPYFYGYVQGYVAIICMLIVQSIVVLHQRQYRFQRGLIKPMFSTIFDDVVRESADQGLFSCFKFLLNYGFYKFGVEICFIMTTIVVAIRLDLFAFLFLVMMISLLFVKRRTCAIVWPFYLLALLILLPVSYALALGLPPMLCIPYPWDGLPVRLISWLYLSDYVSPPDGTVIVGDFFQLLFVCLQWHVFRIEKSQDVIAGGGNNYEASVDVENISHNPVPNFTFNRSYLDLVKSMIFGYAFYVTLAIVFLCATTRISILGLFYLVFAFFFLWYGPKFLTKPEEKIVKQWNWLIGYTIFVITMKVVLQIMACAYVQELVKHNLCWLMQLFGVVCLQFDYNDDGVCELPTDQARLTWDVTCFFFVIFQRRIFTSNYFLYIVLDLEEEERLASRGAELINEILATKVRNKRVEEARILERVKRKMKRIKEKQAKLSKKDDYIHATTHAEAIRGTGGYYMFDDEDADELSDLEAEGIIGTGEPAPKNPLQLAFHGIVEDPKRAIEIDKEHQAAMAGAEDQDDADAAISGEGGEGTSQKGDDDPQKEDPGKGDGKASLEEASDVEVMYDDEDDIEMEQEEQGEGFASKVKHGIKLTWLIFLRSVDTLIHFLDGVSEEYRYVARELRKVTTEGKRRRAMKRQKREAEMQELSTKGPEGDGDGDKEDKEEDPKDDAATGDDAEESAQEQPQREINDFTDDTVSMAETGSSDQFKRTMYRPVRLLYSLLYAIVAQSQLVCYFIIILNQLLSASVLSLPLALIVFLWAMLSVPRPTKSFWITVITYTEIIVIVKYLFQFQFFPWNSEDSRLLNESKPLWWPRILGIEQKANYAALDLCILLAVFFHRSVLIRHGLWQESQVVPNLDEPTHEPIQVETSTDVAIEDVDAGDETDKGKKKKKKKRKKKKDKKKDKEKLAEAAEGGAKAEELLSSGDEQVQDDALQRSLGPEDEEQEDEEKSPPWYQPFVNFYRNMIDPMFSAVTDVYVFIFGIQFILFLIIAFFSYAFGEEQATSDVAQLISSNTIPLSFLLLLLIMFVLIIIDRAIYLCKDVTAKFIYLVALVIVVHIWLFFILPVYNNKPFVENKPAQVWYFFICIYFGLSAYQITSGYPTRILGNFLCRRYNLVSLVLFYGWRVIPFLTELRTLMDWIWTDTTLSLTHWLQVEDIYANVYPIKCFRNREIDYPVPRGTKTTWIIKYGVGGGMLLGLILIVWFPLIFISLANTTSVKNPPTSALVEISIGGFEPLFQMSALSNELKGISTDDYNDLVKYYADDINARSFLDTYRQEDIVVVTISGNSSGTWDISPPSRSSLIDSLENDPSLYISFKYSFTRITENSQVTPTVENTYDVYLNGSSSSVREDLRQQLLFNSTDPGLVRYLIPRFIQVPALSSPEPAALLMPHNYDYGNASLFLETGTIPSLEGTREWWEVKSVDDDGTSGVIQILSFNERVASELLAPLSSYGIIGLYISLVLVIGRFVRMFFSGVSYQIMFNELPNVDRILKLCLDIYLVRESQELELEEDLTAKLIFLYRSPETLIKVTKWKTD